MRSSSPKSFFKLGVTKLLSCGLVALFLSYPANAKPSGRPPYHSQKLGFKAPFAQKPLEISPRNGVETVGFRDKKSKQWQIVCVIAPEIGGLQSKLGPERHLIDVHRYLENENAIPTTNRNPVKVKMKGGVAYQWDDIDDEGVPYLLELVAINNKIYLAMARSYDLDLNRKFLEGLQILGSKMPDDKKGDAKKIEEPAKPGDKLPKVDDKTPADKKTDAKKIEPPAKPGDKPAKPGDKLPKVDDKTPADKKADAKKIEAPKTLKPGSIRIEAPKSPTKEKDGQP